MKRESLNTLYVSLRPDSLSGVSESLSRLTWFAMIPYTLIADKRVKPIDIRVYATIALDARKCIPVAVGSRLIARVLGVSQSVVARSMARLVKLEHIVKVQSKRGQRSVYEFTSPVFMQVEKRGDGEVILTGYSGVPKHIGKVPEPRRWSGTSRKAKPVRKAAQTA